MKGPERLLVLTSPTKEGLGYFFIKAAVIHSDMLKKGLLKCGLSSNNQN
jgi:hypothetical protein